MPGTDDITRKAVAELNRQWMQAYAKDDVDFLQKYMADDYVGTFPDGTVLDKQAEIDAVRSGAVKIAEMTPKEMMVRVYGNAAVITGQSHIEATVRGKAMSADFRFTDVWIAQDGMWRAVSSQVTRIEQTQG